MKRSRQVLAVLGLAVAGVGLAAVIDPAFLRSIPADPGLVAVVGIALAAVGGRAVLVRRREGVEYADLPEVESRSTATVPGAAFDRALTERRPEVRDHLRSVAVDALVRWTGRTEAAAESLLEEGSWSDDRTAAAFFAPGVSPDGGRSIGDRVRGSLGVDGGDVVDQARRAVGAVAALSSVDGPDRVPGPDPPDDPNRPTAGGRRPTRADGAGALSATGSGATVLSSTGSTADLPAPGESTDRETGRWRGIGALSLVAAGVGGLVQQPALLVAAGVGGSLAAYDAYARAGSPPDPDLAVEREVSDADPDDGDAVTVTVAVRNEDEDRLPDCRYVDGVPPGLEVVEGSPRTATTLAPGESTTLSYDVRAEPGRHEFDPGIAVLRGASAATERTVAVEGDGSAITCRLPPAHRNEAAVGLRGRTTDQFGTVRTDAGGQGVEFFGTREYRRGDPVSLVDWNRFARTGDLSTVEFREERAASVVLAVDARAAAYLAPDPGDRSAVRRSVDAAAVVLEGLLDDGNRVGLTALAPGDPPWIPPGGGRDHRLRVRETLATHPSLSPRPPRETFLRSVAEARLRTRLAADAQVVLFSPLADDYPVDLARTLSAHGHAPTVVSPDPTAVDSTGGVLARTERAGRIADLRSAGIPVYDWSPGDPLALALSRPSGGERR